MNKKQFIRESKKKTNKMKQQLKNTSDTPMKRGIACFDISY